MDKKPTYKIHNKEMIYYALRVAISLTVYALVAFFIYKIFDGTFAEYSKYLPIFIIYAIVLLVLFTVRNGILLGFVKSTSVRLNEKQLPEIYKIAEEFSKHLGIKRVPKIYLLQSGGSLNAFAAKFFRSNYIVIYSDLLEAYYENNIEAVEFVIGHELGHIKRHHFRKSVWLFPSAIVPFLPQAYSRGCEYTCDNIGRYFSPKGAVSGIMLLAGGKKIAKRLNIEEYMGQYSSDRSFWRWLVEKMLSHPNLYKRLLNVYPTDGNSRKMVTVERSTYTRPEPVAEVEIKQDEEKEEKDYSRYMPN